ncbi:MAG: hypothetical protein KJ017_12015 [Alphaproteobacteria bacterium]|nr:hypothetical protein [Alphaproteobacteria bacterium]
MSVFLRLFRTYRFETCLLAGLLAIDSALLAGHMADAFSHLGEPAAIRTPSPWNLSTEWGIPEMLEYLLTAVCGLMALRLWRVTGSGTYGFFAFVYFAAMTDNAFSLHEGAGHALEPYGLADHFGQFIALSVFGLIMLLAFFKVFKAVPDAERLSSLVLCGLFAGLAFFSVGLDVLHVPVVVEDGGELIMLSVHTVFLKGLSRVRGLSLSEARADQSLSEAV